MVLPKVNIALVVKALIAQVSHLVGKVILKNSYHRVTQTSKICLLSVCVCCVHMVCVCFFIILFVLC